MILLIENALIQPTPKTRNNVSGRSVLFINILYTSLFFEWINKCYVVLHEITPIINETVMAVNIPFEKNNIGNTRVLDPTFYFFNMEWYHRIWYIKYGRKGCSPLLLGHRRFLYIFNHRSFSICTQRLLQYLLYLLINFSLLCVLSHKILYINEISINS